MNRLGALPICGCVLFAACAMAQEELAGSSLVAEAAPASSVVAEPTSDSSLAADSQPAHGAPLAADPADASTFAAAAEQPADTVPPSEDVTDVEMSRFESNVVCEPRRRPGSRITVKVCFPREEYEMMQRNQAAAAQQYARDLDRERAMKEAQGRMAGPQQRSIIAFQ